MTINTSPVTGKKGHCNGHSPLLDKFLPRLTQVTKQTGLPILDLACGFGRNGLYLNKHKLPVVFADRSNDSLQEITPQLTSQSNTWPIDLELSGQNPLQDKQFSAILVFRYLHRPLFEAIKQALVPGGLIIYETFTVAQAELGRPKNPDFLLKPGELLSQFDNWQALHQFEGIDKTSAIAQLVAVKPEDGRIDQRG